MGKLDGKVAIVTGGGTGIGKGIARAFATEGARVVIASRSEQTLNELVEELGDQVLAVPTDLKVEAQITALFERTIVEMGQLDTRHGILDWATAMMDDSRAMAMVADFHHQLMHTASYDDIQKKPGLFPEFNETSGADMRTEVELFVERTLFDGAGTLEALLTQADIVVLATPGGAETHHMINAATLTLMKSSAVLVNIGRGPVVDEAALAEGLRSGRLGGAALDVFETEPLTAEAAEKFAGLENLVLTPHVAGVTQEANVRVSAITVENVLRELAHADA